MISIACPSCGKKLQVKDGLAGKKVKCPGCDGAIAIPASQVETEEPAAATEPADDKTANKKPKKAKRAPGKASKTKSNLPLIVGVSGAAALLVCGVAIGGYLLVTKVFKKPSTELVQQAAATNPTIATAPPTDKVPAGTTNSAPAGPTSQAGAGPGSKAARNQELILGTWRGDSYGSDFFTFNQDGTYSVTQPGGQAVIQSGLKYQLFDDDTIQVSGPPGPSGRLKVSFTQDEFVLGDNMVFERPGTYHPGPKGSDTGQTRANIVGAWVNNKKDMWAFTADRKALFETQQFIGDVKLTGTYEVYDDQTLIITSVPENPDLDGIWKVAVSATDLSIIRPNSAPNPNNIYHREQPPTSPPLATTTKPAPAPGPKPAEPKKPDLAELQKKEEAADKKLVQADKLVQEAEAEAAKKRLTQTKKLVNQARQDYEQIIREYPNTQAAQVAQLRLQQVH